MLLMIIMASKLRISLGIHKKSREIYLQSRNINQVCCLRSQVQGKLRFKNADRRETSDVESLISIKNRLSARMNDRYDQ